MITGLFVGAALIAFFAWGHHVGHAAGHRHQQAVDKKRFQRFVSRVDEIAGESALDAMIQAATEIDEVQELEEMLES